jgi:hypothetical protein
MIARGAQIRNGICLALLLWFVLGRTVLAAPSALLHTPGFGSPESGDPGDLLVLAGDRLSASDRIVYQAMGNPAAAPPHSIPDESGANLGSAPIIQVVNSPSYLTTKLPESMTAGTIYRLWAVNSGNEWSPAIVINNPRPLWITPPFAYATGDVARLGRRIRIVGRNLGPWHGRSGSMRLMGPATYTLETIPADDGNSPSVMRYVAEAELPKRLVPGRYRTSFSRDGQTWTEVPDQLFEVHSDPQWQQLPLDSPSFGSCKPNDDSYSDECLRRAISAAQQAGGAAIVFPAGTWNFSGSAQFPLPLNVNLSGAGADKTKILRHDARAGATPGSMFVLTGRNSITGIGFSATRRYDGLAPGMAIIQLGDAATGPADISDVIISDNSFVPVGQAVVASGHPIHRLLVTNNLFGAYHVALELPGNRFNVSERYRIDDSVFRSNRFVPGSYNDLIAHQGTIASELGAGNRVDFSRNIADGTSTEALQSADDPKGWRAAFFWDMVNSQQRVLVAENRISCSGDKVGDGEAISFDGNGSTYAFNGAPSVTAATATTVTVHGQLIGIQNDRQVDRSTYYNEHWIQVVDGTGVGQVRRILQYREDSHTGTVEFQVEPAWDILPSQARIIVGPEYYQVYVLANEIDQRIPTCTKGNLTGPRGGVIAMWAPSAASVIEGNRQFDTSGISFQQGYSVTAPSCPNCPNSSSTQIGLEIRGNLIDGEYDWSSDCSWSGIFGSFGASPTPESTPPVVALNISISRNEIRHADGMGGGAIDFAAGWWRGPSPFTWPLIQGVVIYQNVISDVSGPAPRAACKAGQRTRVGIRLGGSQNVSHATLDANRSNEVPEQLEDSGLATVSVGRDPGQ